MCTTVRALLDRLASALLRENRPDSGVAPPMKVFIDVLDVASFGVVVVVVVTTVVYVGVCVCSLTFNEPQSSVQGVT